MDTRPKILVVDDKPENLMAIETVLRDLDVELVKAGSGNDALKATLHYEFALALLDIQMPGMDGYELAGILREEEKTSRLPFIFISAVYTDNLNVFKGYEKGAFSFITKPFQPEILVNKVKFFVEKHQQEVQLVRLNRHLETKNEELKQMNRELEAFSYSVSHDLRVPLRAVNNYSRMLQEDYADILDGEARRVLGNIQFNTRKMETLVDDLLAFAKSGMQSLKKVPVDMNALVTAIVKEMTEVTAYRATVHIGDLGTGVADPLLLSQVWVNLVSNALKYSGKKENPEVNIGCERLEKETVYYIRDNGVGFSMKHADRLFGVFQRLHGHGDFEGTGIGLAIVQKIIVKHGGRIWAEAKEKEGACFYFTLPHEEDL